MPKNNEVEKLESLMREVRTKLIKGGYISKTDEKDIKEIAKAGGAHIGSKLRKTMSLLEDKNKKDSGLYDLVGEAFYKYLKKGLKNQAKEDKYSIDYRTIENLFKLTNNPDKEHVKKILRKRYKSLSLLSIYVGYVGWIGYCIDEPLTIKNYLLNKDYSPETIIDNKKDKKTDSQEEFREQEKEIIEQKDKQIKRKERTRNLVYVIAALIAIVIGYITLSDELKSLLEKHTNNEKEISQSEIFKSKDPNTFKLLIFPFKPYSEEKKYEYEELLFDRFRKIILSDSLNMEVVFKSTETEFLIDPTQAQSIRKKYNADMLIWGNILEQECNDPSLICINYSLEEGVFNKSNFDSALSIFQGGSTGIKSLPIRQIPELLNGHLQESIDNIVFYTVALNHYYKKQYDKAYMAIEKVIRKDECKSKLLLLAGAISIEINQEEKALEYFGSIISCRLEGISDAIFNLDKLLKLKAFDSKDVLFDKYIYTAWCNIGIAFSRMNKLDNALQAFKKAVIVNPNNAEALINLADILSETNHKEEALSVYRKTIQISKDSNICARAWYNVGVIVHSNDNKEEAIKAYKKAVEFVPTYTLPWFNIGVYYQKVDSNEKALMAYIRSIDTNNTSPYPWNNIGNVLEIMERKEKALYSYRTALEIDSLYLPALSNLGNLLKTMDRKNEALRILEKALEFYPQDSVLWFNMGLLLKEMGNKQKALIAFNKSIDIDPTHTGAWFNKGLILYMLNRKKEALSSLKIAVKLKPEFPLIWKSIGKIEHDLGNFDEGLKALNKCLEINPLDTNSLYNSGVILLDLNRDDEAYVVFKRVIGMDSSYSLSYSMIGKYFDKQGKPKEALNNLNKAIELDSNNWDAWHTKALIFLENGDNNNSLYSYKKTLQINPNNDNAWNNIGYLYYLKEEYIKAIDCYKEAIEINTNRPYTYNNIGICYCETGKSQKAIPFFRQSFLINKENDISKKMLEEIESISSNNLEVNIQIAWLNLALHNYKQAMLYFLKSLEYKENKYAYLGLGYCDLIQKNKEQAIKNYKRSLDLWNCSKDFFDYFDDDLQYIEPQGITKEEYNKIKAELQQYCKGKQND